MYNLNCPICLRDIPKERFVAGSAYCSCGHIVNFKAKEDDPSSSSSSVTLLMITSIIVAAILHAFNWDTYFFQIIPLKMKQLSGVASVEDLRTIADICQKRKKATCEIQALEKIFALDKAQLPVLLRVGEIYFEKNNFKGAVDSYTTYFKNGGNDSSGRYNYAQALGELGLFRDAQKQFNYILKKDQKNPQYNVARSYVELLIKNKDYMTAKNVIEEYRRAGPNSALFLEKELKAVNTKLGGTFKTASKSI